VEMMAADAMRDDGGRQQETDDRREDPAWTGGEARRQRQVQPSHCENRDECRPPRLLIGLRDDGRVPFAHRNVLDYRRDTTQPCCTPLQPDARTMVTTLSLRTCPSGTHAAARAAPCTR